MLITVHVPEGAELRVKKGEKVAFDTPLFTVKKSTQLTIPIAKYLRIKPSEIFQYTQVVVGNAVKTGDVLAQAKKMMGTKKVQSEQDGIVSQIDHESGEISLTIASENDRTQPAFFCGTIVNIQPDNSLEVEIGKATIYESPNVTHDFGGKMLLYKEDEYFTIDGDTINESVVIIQHILPHIESKMDALGAEGIIYLEGDTPTSLPSAQCVSEKDFKSLTDNHQDYIYASSVDNKIFTYNE